MSICTIHSTIPTVPTTAKEYNTYKNDGTKESGRKNLVMKDRGKNEQSKKLAIGRTVAQSVG